MKVSRIGQFEFIRMSEPPKPRTPTYQVERRAGVDGQAVWLAGIYSEEQIIRTFVDCPDLIAADNLRQYYFDAIGSRVPISWANIPRQYNVFILDVMPVEDGIRGIVQGVGGRNGSSKATLTVDWKLLPVYPTS